MRDDWQWNVAISSQFFFIFNVFSDNIATNIHLKKILSNVQWNHQPYRSTGEKKKLPWKYLSHIRSKIWFCGIVLKYTRMHLITQTRISKHHHHHHHLQQITFFLRISWILSKYLCWFFSFIFLSLLSIIRLFSFTIYMPSNRWHFLSICICVHVWSRYATKVIFAAGDFFLLNNAIKWTIFVKISVCNRSNFFVQTHKINCFDNDFDVKWITSRIYACFAECIISRNIEREREKEKMRWMIVGNISSVCDWHVCEPVFVLTVYERSGSICDNTLICQNDNIYIALVLNSEDLFQSKVFIVRFRIVRWQRSFVFFLHYF